MKNNTINLVKESWTIVSTIDMETVGELFYNRLFKIAPEVKPMFSRTPLPEQSRKLLRMLGYIISKLDKLEEIMAEVTNLAKRHTAYGVKESHYTAVGTSLLWTLEAGLGQHWNEELKNAWIEVYTTLSSAMITAQQEALMEEPMLQFY